MSVAKQFMDLPECEYLVIGAGAASLSFVDTLLLQQPNIRIVLVDKHLKVGGHWNDAYDYVHLHQPSLVYGLESTQLEGNWLKCMLRHRTLPWNHRASKEEILKYYEAALSRWEASGQVKFFGGSSYDFSQRERYIADNNTHCFSCGSELFRVHVRVKLVNGVLGECQVPSKCPPEFPVDEAVDLITPNQLYLLHNTGEHRTTKDIARKYVVMGAGKTGMDAVVFLQRTMGVSADDIMWVISSDVWMMMRGAGTPTSHVQALLENDGDEQKTAYQLEAEGIFARLDKNIAPSRFKFPVIDEEELRLLRRVKNIVRRGKVTSISAVGGHPIVLSFADGSPLAMGESHYTFVHCTSPGPFNANAVPQLFPSQHEMSLYLLFAPPVTISMSCLAMLESARRNGTLDLEFGRVLLACGSKAPNQSGLELEHEILNELVQAGYGGGGDAFRPLVNLAVFLALLDSNVRVGTDWMKHNRLSLYSIPGSKFHLFEDLIKMVSKRSEMGFSKTDVERFELLLKKLEPLEGH